MLRYFGLLLLSPLFAVGIALRLAFFLPFAVLFLLPMAIMRPRLLLKTPMLFRHLIVGPRGMHRGHWGRGHHRNGWVYAERSSEPAISRSLGREPR